MSKVVNMHKEGYDVDITRNSKWGNPFYIGVDGTRSEVIKKYNVYIRNNKELMDCIHELKDKRLGCHCFPKACHGDVLIQIVKEQEINPFFDFS